MIVLDHGLPIQELKAERRRIAEKLRGQTLTLPTDAEIERLASVQQCISALEAVIAEIDAEPGQTNFELKE